MSRRLGLLAAIAGPLLAAVIGVVCWPAATVVIVTGGLGALVVALIAEWLSVAPGAADTAKVLAGALSALAVRLVGGGAVVLTLRGFVPAALPAIVVTVAGGLVLAVLFGTAVHLQNRKPTCA